MNLKIGAAKETVTHLSQILMLAPQNLAVIALKIAI